MDSIFNTASKIEISAIILAINNDIGKIVEKHLIPHFEEMLSAKHNMKLIETVLRQMPDFKRLEQENEAMRRELDIKSIQAPAPVSAEPVPAESVPVHNCPPTTILMCPYHNTFLAPVPAAPVPAAPVPAAPVPAAQENLIKLEIVEKAPKTENVISEKDIYSDVNLTTPLNNTQVSAGALEEEEEEEEEEASEAEEEEASEAEEEASEVEEVDTLEEEEASEAEEEAEEEEESGVEGGDPLEEEEAEEEEESGVEGGDPLEEEEEVEEEESGVEGGDPLEEEEEVEEEEEESGVEGGDPLEADEVFLVEIKGRGKFYTNNETNGDIYAIEGEDDVGEEVGKFVNKVATFF